MSTALPAPLSLALVITELEIGGAEQALVNLAIGLCRERFSPVVYSLKPRPKNDLLVRRLEEAGIPVHFLNVKSRWKFFGAVKKLAKLFCEQKPRVMQSFLYHANVVGTIAARRAKVPRVVTGIRVADPSRWRQWVERWLTPQMDKIVCVSQGVADYCRDQCRFPAEKLIVIPNGVDLTRFQDISPMDLTELGVEAGQRAIVYVGRLDRQKGLDWLVDRVMPLVFQDLMLHVIRAGGELSPQVIQREHLPSHDLILVGDGPERKKLGGIAMTAGVFLNLHFTGWRADVPRILAACDLLVLPSRWEGMPNVVLEAMAAGKPVVASQAEGVVELLGEGAAQQTCPVGADPGSQEAAAFAEKIVRLGKDRRLAAALGAQNRARAAAEFSLAAMISRYEALYESLVRY